MSNAGKSKLSCPYCQYGCFSKDVMHSHMFCHTDQLREALPNHNGSDSKEPTAAKPDPIATPTLDELERLRQQYPARKDLDDIDQILAGPTNNSNTTTLRQWRRKHIEVLIHSESNRVLKAELEAVNGLFYREPTQLEAQKYVTDRLAQLTPNPKGANNE